MPDSGGTSRRRKGRLPALAVPERDSLTAARERLVQAKAAFSEAARAALRDEPGAAERCDAALRELNRAMAELRTLEAAERAGA
jgi:hypothetical protein